MVKRYALDEERILSRPTNGKAASKPNPKGLRCSALAVIISEEIVTLMRINTMARKEIVDAVAYLRTSSAANVGSDKDSGKRQQAAIAAFAKAAGYNDR